MKIVIENLQLPYDTGCRLLKLKYENCPFPELAEVWNDIVPMTFAEIAELENMEHRRVGVLCLGLERLAAEVKPKLIDRQVIKKSTTWVMQDGTMKQHDFDDVYELYEVAGSYFNKGVTNRYQQAESCYFVKCKDTSTDRNYFIWIDPNSVYQTNHEEYTYRYGQIPPDRLAKLDAIQCIAWTIQTNVPKGNIKQIIRQGDCIMIKPKSPGVTDRVRHLTKEEYLNLLVAES